MTERFIKFIPSEEAKYLRRYHPNAFILLNIIAERARFIEGLADGLELGECYLGDWENYGLSEQNYRTAKKVLIMRQHIKILETNRNRKKSTTGVTTGGTKVKLISSSVYDLNLKTPNDRSNDCLTTDQRLPNDEQERTRKKKNEKRQQPHTPSLKKPVVDVVVDFFYESLEKLNIDEKDKRALMKFPEERVKLAIEYAESDDIVDNLPGLLISHCRAKNPWPPKRKRLSKRERILQKFKHREFYNGAECFITDEVIAFERGMKHEQINFKAANFEAELELMLYNFGIEVQ